MWIVAYTPQIAFEVRVIHGIEAQQRREQAPVGGGDARAQQVTPLRQTDVRVVAKPARHTPLLMHSIILALSASISARSAAGKKSRPASPKASKALLSISMISADSLLMMVRVCLSNSTGTVTRPV